MDITRARELLVGFRRLQRYTRRLQRRGVLRWDWASAFENGYLGDDRVSFLQDMAALKRLHYTWSRRVKSNA